MDKFDVTWEQKEFQNALREYLVESRMGVADAVNKKAGDVAFSASKQMPSAVEVKTKINTDLPRESALWHALATGKTRSGATKFGTAVRGKGNDKIASKIFNSRTRAAGFSRTIYLKIARDFGKSVASVRLNRIKNTTIKKAGAERDRDYLDAVFEVLGIDTDGGYYGMHNEAIRSALALQAADMRKYINRKIAERAKKHSGR